MHLPVTSMSMKLVDMPEELRNSKTKSGKGYIHIKAQDGLLEGPYWPEMLPGNLHLMMEVEI